ncbi:MAG: TonB-dependent receptor, partial [Pseudomonadota bacterium]
GGYNEAGNSGDEPGEFAPGGSPASFEFDDEEAVSFEVGGKMSFFNDRANLNFALFTTDFSNLQVSAFQGESFVVGNAADVTSQGLEVDGIARLSEAWTVSASFTYLDASYNDYATAPCTVEQTAAFEGAGGIVGACQQDLSGRELPFAPEFSGVLALRYEKPFRDLLFGAVTDLNYAGDQFLATDLDPITLQKANTRVNSRISLSSLDRKWELALVGRNLTDENLASFASDAFLLTGVAWQVMQPPRTVELQFNLQL